VAWEIHGESIICSEKNRIVSEARDRARRDFNNLHGSSVVFKASTILDSGAKGVAARGKILAVILFVWDRLDASLAERTSPSTRLGNGSNPAGDS
jgi:hypothetical protein